MVKTNNNEPWKDTRFKRQVILDYINGKIDRKAASIKLHTSSTYVSTLKKRYLEHGGAIFTHGNTGRDCSHRMSATIEEQLCDLYESLYYDFSYQHFCDWIRHSGELAGITDSISISDRTIARILKRNGINSPECNRAKKGDNKIHPLRPRRSSMGELVQLDASTHDWLLTGEKWSIYTAIDDATSLVLAAIIAKTETTEGYFRLFRQLISNYGVPKTFYTDRRTSFVFNGDKEIAKRAKVQFDWACKTLGVDIIKTSNPQAKGRVERGLRSLQSRLVCET